MPASLFADAHAREPLTPVFVLTGFLGSGKTTLLNQWLRDPALADTAVIVNELGDVALDHLLIERIEGEVALLQSGCICCAVRSDFEQTLRELLAKRDEGSIPPFTRVVVETTGLADPAPLIQAVQTQPLLSHFCRLGAVITTVDSVNSEHQLEHQWEARKQVALADRLLLTKTDLQVASPELLSRLRDLNADAERLDVRHHSNAAALLAPMPVGHGMAAELADESNAAALFAGRRLAPLHGDVASFVLRAEAPLDWLRLQTLLAEWRARDGERLLRLKGVVRLVGEDAPVVLHGVHHLFHPPLAAPDLAWPPKASALVLIGRSLDRARMEAEWCELMRA